MRCLVSLRLARTVEHLKHCQGFAFETLARKLATSTHAFAFNVQMQVRILAVNPLHPNV